MGWLKKFVKAIGDTASVIVEGTFDEVTNWFDGKDDEFGQGWQTSASKTDTYGDMVIDSDGDGRVDAWDFNKDGMTHSQKKEKEVEDAFAPSELEQQYADMQMDEYNYWKDNYLPKYQEVADLYRGKDFADMRDRSNAATDRQFDAAKMTAVNTAKGFGVQADIDTTKWDAMQAKTTAGTNQEYKLNFAPDDDANKGVM
jgi:hypothetical protein